MSASEINKLYLVGIVAAFTTLAFLGTTIIRVPLPATGGYFNLGDTFVMAAALLYGPAVGGLVGLVGPAVADAIGFPQFILATAVVKGIEGVLLGLIAGTRARSVSRMVLGLISAVIVLTGGYFVFEAWIYPWLGVKIPFFAVTDFNAALAEIVPNLLQGTISAVLAFAIARVMGKLSRP